MRGGSQARLLRLWRDLASENRGGATKDHTGSGQPLPLAAPLLQIYRGLLPFVGAGVGGAALGAGVAVDVGCGVVAWVAGVDGGGGGEEASVAADAAVADLFVGCAAFRPRPDVAGEDADAVGDAGAEVADVLLVLRVAVGGCLDLLAAGEGVVGVDGAFAHAAHREGGGADGWAVDCVVDDVVGDAGVQRLRVAVHVRVDVVVEDVADDLDVLIVEGAAGVGLDRVGVIAGGVGVDPVDVVAADDDPVRSRPDVEPVAGLARADSPLAIVMLLALLV